MEREWRTIRPRGHDFSWVTYYARDMREKDCDSFINSYCNIDWESLIGGLDCPDEMTRILHHHTDALNDLHFPLQKQKIRSTDDPWITDEIKRVIRKYPRTYESPYRLYETFEIAKIIQESKKTKSAVAGDVLPSLVNACSDFIAIPSTRIINFCLIRGSWPSAWRMETQTAIPKKEGVTPLIN